MEVCRDIEGEDGRAAIVLNPHGPVPMTPEIGTEVSKRLPRRADGLRPRVLDVSTFQVNRLQRGGRRFECGTSISAFGALPKMEAGKVSR